MGETDNLKKTVESINLPSAIIDKDKKIIFANELWNEANIDLDKNWRAFHSLPTSNNKYSILVYRTMKSNIHEEISDFVLILEQTRDGNFKIIDNSDSFTEITSKTHETLKSLPENDELVFKGDIENFCNAIERSKLENTAKADFRIHTKDGRNIWYTGVFYRLSFNTFEIVARQTRGQLYRDRNLEKLYTIYDQILANSPVLFIVVDENQKIIQHSGTEISSDINRTDQINISKLYGQDVWEKCLNAFNGQPSTVRVKSNETSFELFIAPLAGENPKKVMLFSPDFTTRISFEKEILDKLLLLDSLFNSISIGILRGDNSGRINYANTELLHILDMDIEDLINQNVSKVIKLYPNTSGKALRLEDSNLQESLHYDTKRLVYIKDREGRLKNVEVIFNGVYDLQGIRNGFLLHIRDITQEIITQNELEMARRLGTVGRLAGGLTHRFNNILMAISGNLELAQNMTTEKAVSKRLARATESIFHARKLTKSLQIFAFGGTPWKKPTNIRKILKNTTILNLSGSGITPHFHISRSLKIVDIDVGLINEALNNIIQNAKEASEEGGSMSISSRNVVFYAGDSLVIPEGEYVRISIADHGQGMSKEDQIYVMDPFFTTRDDHTGMGLSTAHSIVRNHSGFMKIESEVDHGTRVSIYLPVSNHSQTDIDGLNKGENKLDSIIVQDADPLVREVIGNMLETVGYHAILAETPGNALNLLENEITQNKQPVATVLQLSDISNKKILDNFRKISPQTALILSSAQEEGKDIFRKYGFAGFLPKPFTLGDLRTILRNILHN